MSGTASLFLKIISKYSDALMDYHVEREDRAECADHKMDKTRHKNTRGEK